MTISRLFKTTLRIQPQLNSTQTTELGTTQVKLVLLYSHCFYLQEMLEKFLEPLVASRLCSWYLEIEMIGPR